MEISNPEVSNESRPVNFRVWLQTEFSQRSRSIPKYSLRAFARDLKMDASSLSQIMSGKRKVSVKVVLHVTGLLKVEDGLKFAFLQDCLDAKSKKEKQFLDQAEYHLLAADAFAYISDWYHVGILELMNVSGFIATEESCASKLGISVIESRIAIERLKRLNLVADANGVLVRTPMFLTNFAPGMTSKAHRNLQRQILQKAISAIDECEPEEKDITAMTMAIDVSKIPEARKIIARFRRELCAYLEDGAQSQVFNLAIQLYPISKSS